MSIPSADFISVLDENTPGLSVVRTHRPERRRRARTRVHWAVRFTELELPEDSTTVTEDLSSGGFSCVMREVLAPGEIRSCVVKVPSYALSREEGLWLECRVRVAWVRKTGLDAHATGCEITAYRLRRPNDRLEMSGRFDQ
jgi:hypothetical protein